MAASSLAAFARDGDVAAVRAALSSGTDPNTKYKGQTPLMYAAEKGRVAVIEVLLANGAKVDLVDSYNRTALHFATMCASVDCCRLLVARGASTSIESTLGGESPLDIAKMRTLLELQKLFLQARDGVTSPLKPPAAPKPGGVNIFSVPAADAAKRPLEEEVQESADEAALPVAMSMPRRVPQAEMDEVRRNAPAPRATEE